MEDDLALWLPGKDNMNSRRHYKETFSAVRVGGNLTEWFNTVVGVLQGCVLSSLLFNVFLEITIITAIDDDASGAWLNGVKISDLRFADDIALLAESKNQLQKTLDSVAEVSAKMGIKMNVSKTETQFLGKGSEQFTIHLEGQDLTQVDNFILEELSAQTRVQKPM